MKNSSMSDPDNTLHLYLRVSSDPQADDGTSLEEQKKLGIQTAKSRGMEYVVWEEGAASSHNEGFSGRPQFLELLGRVKGGEVKHLFVTDINRLSRNKTNSNLIEYELASNRVTLHMTGGIYELGDPQSDLVFSMMSAFSRYDNESRMERFRLGRFNRVSQGRWHGGAAPYGYDLQDKKLVINNEQSMWVKFIFTEYANGTSPRDIRNQLTNNGVKTNRGKDIWSIGSVEKVLTNTHYDGWYEVTDSKASPPQTYRVECPRIIPEVLFTKVKTERSKRQNKRVKNSNQKNFYFLKGFLKCADCGRQFHGRTSPKQYDCYYCPSKERRWVKGQKDHKDWDCKNSRYLRIEETDRLIWDTVVEVLRESNQYKESVKNAVMGTPKATDEQIETKRLLEVKLKSLTRQLKDFKKSLAEIETKLILKNGDPEILKQVKENVEDAIHSQCVQIENTEVELDDLTKSTRWVDWVQKFGDQLESIGKESPENRHEFLQGILKNIVVKTVDSNSHTLTLNFHVPYVDDELISKDQKKKSAGYKINGGKRDKSIEVDTSKKVYERTS
jgi:site-specific DNA recombinase